MPSKEFKTIGLRTFFSGLEKKREKKHTQSIEDLIEEQGLEYIQLKLPIDHITPEFENRIRQKIEPHILTAKVREASEEDLEGIMDLYNHAWLTSREPFSNLTLEPLRTLFFDADIKMFIVKLYGTDVGFIILDLEGTNKEYGVIAGLGILPRYQGKGLGKLLGMTAWNYLKTMDIKELRCEVHKDNIVSYNFIKSLGFTEYGKKVYELKDFR